MADHKALAEETSINLNTSQFYWIFVRFDEVEV